MKTFILILLMGLTVGCGKQGPMGPQGVQGEQGVPGVDGQDGQDGAGCSVTAIEASEDAPNGGARVVCGDTTVLILNGVNGLNGSDGEDGTTTVIHCTVNKHRSCE